MTSRTFTERDIGSDLLPILTRGLYRDPLDALREYIQNGIDAGSTKIEITLQSDVVTVRDYGTGMSRAVAERAIRLAMSEKDPTRDVGFRGIGIYSAFNVCDEMEVLTRPARGPASRLSFDFKSIRKRLDVETQKRVAGKAATLSLVELLTDNVIVGDVDSVPFDGHGTLVVLSGVAPNVSKRVNRREEVVAYLESVVPLPFHKDFGPKKDIEAELRKRGQKTLDLFVSFGSDTVQLYRPYMNEIFEHHKGEGPRFFSLIDDITGAVLGFAWVCMNDARKYLPVWCDVRGLLVKKHGFSVGNRDFFLRYFPRVVFNHRCTGEIIITSDALLPNAARSEFEHTAARDSLYVAFGKLATDISKWGNELQDEQKAQEELALVSPAVFELLSAIPAEERDVERLLDFNTRLDGYERRLQLHESTLRRLEPKLLDRTQKAIAQAKGMIAAVLRERQKKQQKASGRSSRVQRAASAQRNAPAPEDLKQARARPKSLLELLESYGWEVQQEWKQLIEFIDAEVLKRKFDEKEYQEMLETVDAYVVFLEAKYRSGLSQRTTMDAHRNQLVRLLDVVYEYAITANLHPRQPYVLLLGVAKEEPAQLTAYRDPKQLLTELKHHSRFPDHHQMAALLSQRVGYASWSGLGDIISDAAQRAKRMEQGLLQDVVMYIRHKVSTASLPGGSALQLGFPELGPSDEVPDDADPPNLSMSAVTTTSRAHGR